MYLLIADTQDEIDHHSHAGEEHAAGHPLAIKHEEEGEIDQSRPRLFLSDDKHHRHQNDSTGRDEITQVLHAETVCAHELTDGQRSSELGKLSRLQTYRAHDKPRARAFDFMGVEDGAEEQQQHGTINEIGKRVVVFVVKQ